MAMVSTAKATKVIGVIRGSRPYTNKLMGLLKTLGSACEAHPLFSPNPEARKKLLVVVTANRGLCGGYNANILKLARKNIDDQTDIIMFGKKGGSVFKFSKIECLDVIADLPDLPSFDSAVEFADKMTEAFQSGEYKEIKVVYTKFHSAGNQAAEIESLLPLSASEEEVQDDIEPIFHPDRDELVGELIPRLVRLSMFRYLLDAKASEHLARQMAMNSASDNANEMVKTLNLTYNRARQAAITTEISEIVGGAEALN
jgi:F-type H+-transporting ATPase subunit gamma